MKTAFVLICLNPYAKLVYLDFLNKFNNYSIYVIVDDNNINCDSLKHLFQNIHFIQLDNNLCNNKGFKNLNYIIMYKEITGWDKALYYFTYVNTKNYSNVWFCEDDVYFFSEDTISNIDLKYPEIDILCNSSYDEAKLNEWHWSRININLKYPYYCGMMCIIRLSQNFFKYIKEYADNNNTLFFLEAFFPTIAKHNNLNIVVSPIEFKTVTYNQIFSEYNNKFLYHPVKNMEKHIQYRQTSL
jgi:hypothetical protein